MTFSETTINKKMFLKTKKKNYKSVGNSLGKVPARTVSKELSLLASDRKKCKTNICVACM
jgi:hypothetical protein